MKHRLFIKLLVCFPLVLSNFLISNYGYSIESKSLTVAQSNTSTNLRFGLLDSITGRVWLKRAELSKEILVTGKSKKRLNFNDLLRLEQGSKAIVICPDSTRKNLPIGKSSLRSIACPEPSLPPIQTQNSFIEDIRGGELDFRIPYIISPRSTSLLTSKPILKWNPVEKANIYTVEVRGNAKTWWKTVVKGKTEVIYNFDGKGESLQPGINYKLIIKTDNQKSSNDEDLPNLEFKLLCIKDAQMVRNRIEQITQGKLDDEVKALLYSYIYSEYDLNSEAIEKITPFAKASSQNVEIYLLLGKLYKRVALNPLAQQYYEKASVLSDSSKDTEALAIAQNELAHVYLATGNNSRAIQLLQKALSGYESLGDSPKVKRIKEKLQQLKQQN